MASEGCLEISGGLSPLPTWFAGMRGILIEAYQGGAAENLEIVIISRIP